MAVLKKSGFEDAFFVIAVIFTIAIFILIMNNAWSGIRPELETSINQAIPENTAINITKNFDSVTDTGLLFDKLLPLVLIGLFAFVFISVALYINHPIMIVVGIIVLSVAVLLGVIYANIYHQISSSDEFSATNANLPITEQFMKYLPFIILILFVGITIVIIYSRSGGTGGL
jgi:hypothetical protein